MKYDNYWAYLFKHRGGVSRIITALTTPIILCFCIYGAAFEDQNYLWFVSYLTVALTFAFHQRQYYKWYDNHRSSSPKI